MVASGSEFLTIQRKFKSMKTLIALMSENVGQVHIDDAQSEVDRMNRQQKTDEWHIDNSDFLFCPDETDHRVFNPCPLDKENDYVWITKSNQHS